MGRLITVPMRDEGTALPIYATAFPQPVFASSPNNDSSYEVVELTDSNRYQTSRMVWTDINTG